MLEFSGVSTRALVEALLDLMEAYGFSLDRCWRFYTEYARNANLPARDRMDILTSMPPSERVLKEIETIALGEIDKGASADHTVIHDAYIALRASGQESNAREIWELFRAQSTEAAQEGMQGPEAGPGELPQHLEAQHWPHLSDERVAIVGGTRQVREKVVAVVREECRPRALVEVPPSWERNLSQSDIDRLLRGATFVVVIKGALKHSTTNMVDNWKRRQRHKPRIVRPQGRGVSGVLAAIIREAAQGA